MTSILSHINTEADYCLRYNILPYWLRLRDLEHGGFYGQVRGDETIVPTADRSAVLYARLLWTFSACAMKEPAQCVKEYILRHFIDDVYGGTYWAVNYLGQPVEQKKQCYAQAFMLYAFSEYARVMGEEEALQVALCFYRWIETYFKDDMGGYIEATDRQWQSIDDMRLSDKDENFCKSQNNHLHILEAYTNLYRVWQDNQLKQSINQLIQLFEQHIIQRSGHLGLFFDNNWTVSNKHFSYGHDVEASWLLDDAAQTIGINIDKTILLLSQSPFPEHNLTMDWWEPAEAVIAYLNRYNHLHDEQSLLNLQKAWTYIQNHLIDTQHGEWFWSAQQLATHDKAGAWKCPYHNTRMCLEIIKRNTI